METTKTISKSVAQKYYAPADEATKEVLRELFGADFFKFDYTDIKTYSDACNVLGMPEHIMQSDTRGIMEFQAMANAVYKLLVICKAMNSDTGSYYDKDGWGYYPVFVLYSKQEMEEMGEAKCKEKGIHQLLAAASAIDSDHSGVRCADTNSRGAITAAYSGFPLCLNSEEKAEYVGKQFFELCCACYGVTPKMD